MMRNVIRISAMALALAIAGAPFGTGAASVDGAPGAEPRVSDPGTAIAPGAASPEPQQALVDPDEVENSAAHAEWLQGIWTSP
jgi:hypothetical protein